MKPARLRPAAEDDLVRAVRDLAREAGRAQGQRLFDAALAALKPIERMPAMVSPRLGLLCDVPGLRSWRVTGYALTWLCFEAEGHLDVVRLLGERQDMLAILAAPD